MHSAENFTENTVLASDCLLANRPLKQFPCPKKGVCKKNVDNEKQRKPVELQRENEENLVDEADPSLVSGLDPGPP